MTPFLMQYIVSRLHKKYTPSQIYLLSHVYTYIRFFIYIFGLLCDCVWNKNRRIRGSYKTLYYVVYFHVWPIYVCRIYPCHSLKISPSFYYSHTHTNLYTEKMYSKLGKIWMSTRITRSGRLTRWRTQSLDRWMSVRLILSIRPNGSQYFLYCQTITFQRRSFWNGAIRCIFWRGKIYLFSILDMRGKKESSNTQV